jgi:hypothetical protein
MRQHSNLAKGTAEKVVKDIRRATRKQYSAEEKIRIVLEGLRFVPRTPHDAQYVAGHFLQKLGGLATDTGPWTSRKSWYAATKIDRSSEH